MDRFLSIDWNPPLEDLIDNTFISEKRLEKESVMHRIITGNFIDPFKNIENDYKKIRTDLMEDIEIDLNEQDKNDNVVTIESNKEIETNETKKNMFYVPGIIKPIFKFPKKSNLSKEEQAMCLRVLLRFSESDKPKLTLGQLPEVKLPTLTSPLSEDANCQRLAESNNVDLVISSSGLNCLVNNIGPTYSNSWVLPLVIRRHNDKNVIYIDKPGPPPANTVSKKNTWVYKYILKYSFIDAKHPSLNRINESTEKFLKQRDVEIDPSISEGVKSSSQPSVNDIPQSNISNFTINTTGVQNSSKMTTESNVSYKLFTIGPQNSEKNELMKNVIKKYKMLVRSKTDGVEILPNNVQKLLLLAPKLEHQPDLGAEAVTLEESLRQWISLIFRPLTFLARVRISVGTSEVLQIEQRTAVSINNEIKRLYNVKAENSLTVLHNVIQCVANLSPGRYIMRHTVRHGPFAVVYKEVESPGKNIFDLHTVYSDEFLTLPNPPWIPLDKIVPTPMLKIFERMPAMFYPLNEKPFLKNKKFKKTKKSNAGTVRRSLRNKKKK
ncbi:NMDA receptor-regulated protein 2 [Dufourea novaeangliae]|uniref:NMDA receptor-regulated protein 2 n=1 Tax=Dufourea novaeangliae TaxID=178035 RepID=A0A154NW17_DUFNO|nr:NMDA receptor-regulated protein 2 [Dufourea novaeangliae]